jgi:hypothetical protein
VVLGNQLYVLGGTELRIENASIRSDGTLANFNLTGAMLDGFKVGGRVVVTSSRLYLVGGGPDTVSGKNVIEQADLF